MKPYKRLIIIGIVLIPFLAFIPIRAYRTQSFTPEVLQEKLAQEGCFYSSAEDCYQISDVDFGRELSETVVDLGLDEWYTEKKTNTIQDLNGESNYTIADPLIVSVFDAKYLLSLSLSNYKCYQIGFSSSFIYDSKTAYLYDNIMEYDDACTYFYNLYDEFVVSYGEPDVRDFPVDLNEITLEDFTDGNSYYPVVYAYWVTGEEGQQSVLHLSARPFYTKDTESNQVLDLSVYINVGQEIEGISIDDLT